MSLDNSSPMTHSSPAMGTKHSSLPSDPAGRKEGTLEERGGCWVLSAAHTDTMQCVLEENPFSVQRESAELWQTEVPDSFTSSSCLGLWVPRLPSWASLRAGSWHMLGMDIMLLNTVKICHLYWLNEMLIGQ